MPYGQTQAPDLMKWLQEQLSHHSDMVYREFAHQGIYVSFIYLSSVVDGISVNNQLITPLFQMGEEHGYKEFISALPNSKPLTSKNESLLNSILFGGVVVSIGTDYYLYDGKRVNNNTIKEAQIETVIQGPQYAFSEDLAVNMNLIRHRYHQQSLRLEKQKVGNLSQTEVGIVYDANLVSPKVLKKVKDSIQRVDIPVLQAAGQLQNHINLQKRALFPTMMLTERPDRAVFNLSQGKIVVVIEGTPFALVVPAVFYDFISSMEDVYQSYWISKFLITLRYLGLFFSITLPGAYVALTAFNPEVFRVQLALSIAGSRVGVPFPAFTEVTFMLLMMELLTEASVRLPKTVGQTAATVGGLILGQAATEAGLVSNIMIIVVSAVAVSNFVIPITAMGFAMRFVKYVILAFATAYGLMGLVIGVLGLLIYLISLDSFGKPYFSLISRSTIQEVETSGRGEA